MKNEYEMITHPRIKYLKPFLVNLSYRNNHLHNDFELCLVLKGSLSVYSKKETYTLPEQSLILFNPMQPHELRAPSGQALILSLQVSQKFCRSYFPTIHNIEFDANALSAILPEEQSRLFSSLLLQLSYCYFKKEYGYEFQCISLVNRLFYVLIKNVPHHFISDEERMKNTVRFNRIDRIIRYIEENYSSKLLLSAIAERESLSLAYLSYFFKENLNITFQEYLKQVRFEKAKQLIVQTNAKLIDICLETGFSDTRYLNQMFIKQYGCTPSQYRDQVRLSDPVPATANVNSIEHFFSEADSLDLLKAYCPDDDGMPIV